MWWEARDAAEGELIAEVARLHSRYQEDLHNATSPWPVRGVGAGSPGEAATNDLPTSTVWGWRPLILVDDRAIGSSPATPGRFAFRELDRESAASQALQDWQPADDVLIEPVGPIIPAVGAGDSYHPGSGSGSGSATVGLPVMSQSWTGSNPGSYVIPGFLTVAHGVGPTKSAVTLPGGATGEVAFKDESALNAKGGDDIALVTLDPPHQMSPWLANQGTHAAPGGPPYAQLAADLYGGISKHVLGQVTAVLLQHGDNTWQWLDCWELGGVTQPLMQRGDSGALAIDPSANPCIFGHFVGGAVALRGTGFTSYWVQDLGRVLGRQSTLAGMIDF